MTGKKTLCSVGVLACALVAGAGTSAATTFRVDSKHDHSRVIPIKKQRTVDYEVSYTGLGYYRRDYSDRSPSSGEGNDCPPIGAVTSEDHVRMKIAFDAVWHIWIRVDGKPQGKHIKGRLKTNGSSYTQKGFYYDEACEKHSYPATGGADAKCKGRLLPEAGPPILYGYSGRQPDRIHIVFEPFEGFKQSPVDCPVSPSDFEPNPDPKKLIEFPDVNSLGTVARRFLRQNDDGSLHYRFDTHLPRDCGSGDTTTCKQSFIGDGNVIFHYLRRDN
jgi:hypothetical protein